MRKIYLFLSVVFALVSSFSQNAPTAAPTSLLPTDITTALNTNRSTIDIDGLGNQLSTATAPTFSSAQTGSSIEVGITEGELSVSLAGTATYNIPIAVPPGINGVEPKISLTYSSTSGIGVAGYGWNITGFSTISRIASTVYHDGISDPVDFDALDRFALDGQRLIVKTGIYGENNSTYETEVFSNTKITYYISSSSSSFLVQYPDGSSATFGGGTNARSSTTWGINYWVNPQNFYISYTYQILYDNLYITAIKYGGNDTLAQYHNKILFTYKNRTITEQGYIAGQNIENTKILSSIQVIGYNIPVRNYALEHTPNGRFELLTKFFEKNGDNSLSYNPTVFTYGDDNQTSIKSIARIPYSANYWAEKIISGDYNEDGKSDFVFYNDFSNPYDSFKVYSNLIDLTCNPYFGQCTGPTNAPQNSGLGTFANPALSLFNSKQLVGNAVDGFKYKSGWTFIQKITNGNPQNDTYTAKSYYLDTSQNVILNDTKNFTNNDTCDRNKGDFSKFLSGDFNGDGLSDVVGVSVLARSLYYDCTDVKLYFINLKKNQTTNFYTDCGTIHNVTNNYLFAQSKFEIIDFNGDGRSDILFFDYNIGFRVFTLNAAGTLFIQLYSAIGTAVNITSAENIFIGDFNGDGKTDFVKGFNGADSWRFYMSTGITFTVIDKSIGLVYDTNSAERVDYNDDLPYLPNIPEPLKETYYTIFSSYLVKDLNGDGKSDIFCQRTRVEGLRRNREYIFLRYYPYGMGFTPWVEDNTFVGRYANILNKTFCPTSITSTNIDFTALTSPLNPIYGSGLRFLDINENPASREVIRVFDGYIYRATHNFKKDDALTKIITGNGATEKITYESYNATNPNAWLRVNSSPVTENYPKVTVKVIPDLLVVTKLEKQTAADYKMRYFNYTDATVSIDGLGFLGFKSSLNMDWYNNATAGNTQVNFINTDVNLRGTVTSKITNTISRWFNQLPNLSQSTFTYNNLTAVKPNKVFKLQALAQEEINGLTGVTTIQSATDYNIYGQPLINWKYINKGSHWDKTKTTSGFEHFPTAPIYIVNRPISKNIVTTINVGDPDEDLNSIEETYSYGLNKLLSQTKTRATNSGVTSNFVTEDNSYDIYGSLTKKITTALGLTPRETNYEFSAAYNYRFLTKSKDVDGLETEYTYDNSTGALLSEKLPSNLGSDLKTTYTYDTWGKKINTLNYLGNNQTIRYVKQIEKTLVTTTTIAADGDSVSTILLDAIGRKIKTGTKTLNGDMSYVDYEYDNFDRISKVSEPHFTAATPLWNLTTYDDLGRLSKTVTAAGKTTNVTYNGLTTAVNDGTQTKSTTKNNLGNVVSVTDAPGGTIYYTYFANDNLKSSALNGVSTTILQDAWGRKKELNDPSAGIYKYTYNDFGEITKEENPKGFTDYTYSSTGKLSTKTINDAVTPINTSITSTYTYDPTTKMLSTITVLNPFDGNNTFKYVYDNFKRLKSTEEKYTSVQPRTFSKLLEFDAYGRVKTETIDATAFGKSSSKVISSTYQNGQLIKTYDGATATGTPLWETSTQNARGQVTTGFYGNGITATNVYDNFGFPTAMTHTKLNNGAPANVMQLINVFDTAKANLTSRTNSLFAWNEAFTYDTTDRLTQFNNSLGLSTTQEYHEDGKIKVNSLGTYKYTNAAKPYLNTSLTSLSQAGFDYYNTARNKNQEITYNAFNSPIDITQFNEKISFGYNALEQRSLMYYGSNAIDKNLRPFRKCYSSDGSIEIKYTSAKTVAGVTTPEKVEFFTYIGGDAYSAPIVARKIDNGNLENFYLHRDYQGSILAITNNIGDIIEKRLFDAWGEILKTQDGAGNTLPKLTFFDRGYTGHEHLQNVGLINMNGRIYDAKLHRFLQADENIQDPFNSQNFNRYSYVLNNPLKYTDPSGESWGEFFAFLGKALLFGYVANAQATGEANPTKWSSTTWQNFGLGVGSISASYAATNSLNNYVDHYNDKPNLGEPSRMDGFVDTLNPVKIAEGMIMQVGSYGKSLNSIASGNGNLDDISNLYSIISPADGIVEGLHDLGSQAFNGNEYAQGVVLSQAVLMIVTKNPGTGAAIEETIAANRFRSFSAIKRFIGAAGEGKAWHHIVEQGGTNIAKFGADVIHNVKNLIKLPHGKGSIHAKISGYYSSKRPFTNGLTVRQWLSTQSYEAQFEFGIKILKKFGWEE